MRKFEDQYEDHDDQFDQFDDHDDHDEHFTLLRSRRAFLKQCLTVPFFSNALAERISKKGLPASKNQLTLLSDRPLNAETPAHLLDPELTSNELHFVRNNGFIPEKAQIQDASGWSLQIDGEVFKSKKWTLEELKKSFEVQNANLVIECAGNGRAGFYPIVKGNPWTLGAVGCAQYKGIRLADLLEASGVKDSASYIAYYGSDLHLSRDPKRSPISRGVPIEKAMDQHTLLVWEMNGKPLPPEHGFPLRLICPGWPGSTCGKWLRRIWVRDRIHDGEKMGGSSYRIPRNPVPPGKVVPDDQMEIITIMPVKSIITSPRNESHVKLNHKVEIRGHAWSGSGKVEKVELSYDFGARWRLATLLPQSNPYAWQRWWISLFLPKGYHEIWARATDDLKRSQPMIVPGWNPKGYLNNAMHRISLYVD